MSYKKTGKKRVLDSQEGYDLYAATYDESLAYLDSFEGREGELLFHVMGDIEGKKVLDVGCGTGRLVPGLSHRGAEVVGVDISEEMLKVARKKFPRFEFKLGDIEELPFEDESFDVVVAAFVIVHLKDLERAFREVYRVLKPGGSFVLTNINQRKAPKLKLKNGEEIVIDSYYHIPKHVAEALEKEFFELERDELFYDGKVWINQIIKAVKN